MRPDLECLPLRGNVDTRIRKLKEGQYDAIILAAAGLIRLGMQEVIREYIPVEKMIPSVGQGALAIEMRISDPSPLAGEGRGEGDKYLIERIRTICNHGETEIAVGAERAFLQTIGGDCHTALAAHAVLDGDRIFLLAYYMGTTGRIEGSVLEAKYLGSQVASEIINRKGAKSAK
jgi:hydroxymethylbilane synthase